MTKKEVTFREVPAVRKAVAILQLLSKESESMGVNTISKKLGLIPSTCLHILRVLASEGLVAVEAGTKRYSLDVGILSLARSLLRGNELAGVLEPELDRLSRKYNVSMIAEKVIDIEHSVVIAVCYCSGTMRLNVEVGSRFPTLVSAAGRCFAAFGGVSEDDSTEHFPRLRWNHAPTIKEWKKQIEDTKKQGYAVDKAQYISGHMVVAVPIIERSLMTYCIAAVSDVTRIKKIEKSLVKDILQVIEHLNL